MDQDWLAHVRAYVSNADEAVVKKIVNYCGISLRKRDSSLVSFSDPKETARVRENFLRKKLALTDDDVTLDGAIAGVGERMKGDTAKNRVTVYYLLAEHFDMLDLFGGTKTGRIGGSARNAAAGTTVAALAAIPAAAAPEPAAALAAPETAASTVPPVKLASTPAPASAPASADRNRSVGYQDDGVVETGCLALAVVVGAIVVAALLAYWISRPAEETAASQAPIEVAAPSAEPSEGAAPAVPDGAGVVAGERDGKPMVTTYFDTGKAEVAAAFAAATAPVVAYMEANPGARVAISGFNDPSGNAAANAELSKNRAEAVQAALVALGIDEARTDLVKPEDTTTSGVTPEQARRVELTVSG